MTDARRGERLFRKWADATASGSPDPEKGRARFLTSLQASRRRPRYPYFLAAAALLVVGALALISGRKASSLTFATGSGERRAGAWLATSKADELPLSFSEGTRLVMEPDSRGRVEQLGANGATFTLERGEVRAHVVHTAQTDWRFHAGPFEVQVTGTVLVVDWDPARERFEVHVDEGSVVVRGPSPDAVQVVKAGDRYFVDVSSHTRRLSPIAEDAGALAPASMEAGTVDALPAAPATPTPRVPSHSTVSPSLSSWMPFEEQGDYDGAYAAAAGAGFESVLRASSPDGLLRLADVGQLSGHRDAERAALLTCRRRFPGTEPAAVAAYKLGRASSAMEAAGWFEAYLHEQPAGALAREASGRLLEARVNAGNVSGARDAATAYLARYPDGPHTTLARRVLSGDRE